MMQTSLVTRVSCVPVCMKGVFIFIYWCEECVRRECNIFFVYGVFMNSVSMNVRLSIL